MALPFIEAPSPNHDQRRVHAPIDILLLHYTGMPSAGDALERLIDGQAEKKVSSHYLIDEDGTLYRLVAEANRAWHAGVSFWAGERDINSRSIGIELVNPGHEFGYRAFPAAQIDTLKSLCLELLDRHRDITPARVLGHSDVAPTRKQDPGVLFPWEELAQDGIGLWPSPSVIPSEVERSQFEHLLTQYGYETGPDITTASLVTFQRHFRPANIDGVADEETIALLVSLCKQIEQ